MAMSPKNRKKKSRQEKADKLEAMEAQEFKAILYRSDYEAIDRVVEAGDFENREEAIVVIMRNIDKLISCDSHTFNAIVDVKNLRTK